ncbi:uncharacterized protein LOC129286285 [Prosopis cineraria]|uniref:uncharacterized protein LOC129286285 n=1 Tax=Prosopis cineraria TaxID=364024 RepID=UPI00240F0FA7|nr:uncharacterized protein LOC129286285 [Prosopis cineraria]
MNNTIKLCEESGIKGEVKYCATSLESMVDFYRFQAWETRGRWIKVAFARSGETISRQFHVVLKAIIKIGKYYIKEINSDANYQDNDKWKFFEGALGALDGTHVQMTVPIEDRARYQNMEGELSTNVLAVCDPKMIFSYVLPG